MSSGTYFPPPVRAVSIPKKSGGQGILGVPTVADRVAQMVVKQAIEPTLDPVFLPDSSLFAHWQIGMTGVFS
jgi:RNA-directed DNA polymerase